MTSYLALLCGFRISLDGLGLAVDDGPVCVKVCERQKVDEDSNAVVLNDGGNVVAVQDQLVQEQKQAVSFHAVNSLETIMYNNMNGPIRLRVIH